IHVYDDLNFRTQTDLLVVGDHVAREAMHHEDFGRQVVLPDDPRELLRGVVDVRRVHRPDLRARALASLHHELGIDRQMDVGLLQDPLETWKDVLQAVRAYLEIDEEEAPDLPGPGVDHLDRRVLHDAPVVTARPRLSLCHYRHHV